MFDGAVADYDAWYDRHSEQYAAELAAVRRMVGPEASRAGRALEVGVGSGRFAGPLGIGFGVDPAPRMAALANTRGCRTVVAEAGHLPFRDGAFAWTAFLTSLCFVPDPAAALREARRVTSPGGCVVVAYLDRLTAEGRALESAKATNPYYAAARLLSGPALQGLLRTAGFEVEDACSVVSGPGATPSPVVVPGTGRGLYAVVRARQGGRPSPVPFTPGGPVWDRGHAHPPTASAPRRDTPS